MKRRALFIGVDEYNDPQIQNLRFSRIDAHSLNELFADIGYDVKYLPNPTKADLLAAVRERTSDLKAGDSFLFYFAGHGFTQHGHDLIFCCDDVYDDMRFDDAGLKFEKLRLRTESNGAAYDRVFILDACRSDFLTGTRGAATYARDLVPVKNLVKDVPKTGSLTVLRSCSRYQYALEIESRQHGLFTCALLDVMRTARREGSRLAFDESFADAVAKTMAGIAHEASLTATQTPDFAKSAGCAAHVLLEERQVQSATAPVIMDPMRFEQTAGALTRTTTGEADVVEMFRMFARAKREREQVALLPGEVKTEFAKEIRDIEEDFVAAEDAKACAANDAATTLVARVLEKIKSLMVKVEKRGAKAEAELGGIQLWAGGPYWAECNVGATKPEEAGYYFWWGDDARDAAPPAQIVDNTPVSGRAFSVELPRNKFLRMRWCPATESGVWCNEHNGSDFFMMGSPTDEPCRKWLAEDDRDMAENLHSVRLTSEFWIGEVAVTQGQWKAVMGSDVEALCAEAVADDTPYEWPGSDPNRKSTFRDRKRKRLGAAGRDYGALCYNMDDDAPVYFANWNDASEFCYRLTVAEQRADRLPKGYVYRLPTEAEWEYACRAGAETTLPNGIPFKPDANGMNATALDDIAWYAGNSFEDWEGRGEDPEKYGRPQQNPALRMMAQRSVYGKNANAWGIKGMLGNVWEWCLDFAGAYPLSKLQRDPHGPGGGNYHIVRGGCWYSDAFECRPAARWRHEPGFRNWSVGFRIVLAKEVAQ